MKSAVLITVDCLRADHVGCYGYDRPTTPNIDEFAHNATRFEHAYSNSPGTRYAIQSLNTGVWTRQIEGIGIPENKGTTIAEFFSENGYDTGFFAYNGFISRDFNYHRGVDQFMGVTDFDKEKPLHKQYLLRLFRKLPIGEYKSTLSESYHRLEELLSGGKDRNNGFGLDVEDDIVVDNALKWIESKRKSNSDYFLWVHLMNVHTPFGRYENHLKTIRGDTDTKHVANPEAEGVGGSTVNREHEIPQRLIDTYDAAVRSADEQIGRILDAVEDDSMVIITSDHGEEMGEFGKYHEISLYSTMSQIPLLVSGPGFKRGLINESPVQHLDIPVTFAEWVDGTQPSSWEGDPLQAIDREYEYPIYFELDNVGNDLLVGLRSGDYKLIKNIDAMESKLYRASPGEIEKEDIKEKENEKYIEMENIIEKKSNYTEEHEIGFNDSQVSDSVEENLELLGYR